MIPFLAPVVSFFGSKLGKFAAIGIGAVLLVLVIWWQIAAYGERRADARETEVRAEYKAASDRLREEARQSATRADDDAVVRLERHQEQVREEQERIDAAEQNGQSPLDVLFGG